MRRRTETMKKALCRPLPTERKSYLCIIKRRKRRREIGYQATLNKLRIEIGSKIVPNRLC